VARLTSSCAGLLGGGQSHGQQDPRRSSSFSDRGHQYSRKTSTSGAVVDEQQQQQRRQAHVAGGLLKLSSSTEGPADSLRHNQSSLDNSSVRVAAALEPSAAGSAAVSAAHSAGTSRAMSRTSSSKAFAEAAVAAAAAPLAFLDSSDDEDERGGSSTAGAGDSLAGSRGNNAGSGIGPDPAGMASNSSSGRPQPGPVRGGESRAKLLAVSGGGYNAEKLQRSLSMVTSARQSRVQEDADSTHTSRVPRRRQLSEQGVQLAAQAAAAAAAVASKHLLSSPASLKEVQRSASGFVRRSFDHMDSSSTAVRSSFRTSVSFKEPAVQAADSNARHRHSTEGSRSFADNRRQQAAIAQAAHMLASDSD
jgi:hypothetical protein